MKIRTNCKGCVFNTNDSCSVGKKNENNFIDGFCSIKRQTSVDLEDIMKEEQKLSCILLAKTSETCKVLDFIHAYQDVFDQFIILSVNYKKQDLINIVEFAKDKKINITSENVHTHETYEDHTFIDALIRHVKNNWFIVLEPHDVLNYRIIRKIKMSDIIDRNMVCGYFNKDNTLKILVNKFAFQQVKGNQDMPFLIKIQDFENWDDKCFKLQ